MKNVLKVLAGMVLMFAASAAYADHDQLLRCESWNNEYKVCHYTGTPAAIRLEQQVSRTPCVRERTWGMTQRGIWVAHGCRAIFRLTYRDFGGGANARMVRCESWNRDYQECRQPRRIMTARLVRQISGASCIQGHSWGFQGPVLWVSNGCRAQFQVWYRMGRDL